MTNNQRLRITLMQILQQHPQRTLLFLRACVLGSLAVGSQSADIAYANGVAIVVLAVGTLLSLGTSLFNRPVNWNDIVIPTSLPSEGTVVAVDVLHSEGTALAVSGAVHNNKSNLSHNINAFGFE